MGCRRQLRAHRWTSAMVSLKPSMPGPYLQTVRSS